MRFNSVIFVAYLVVVVALQWSLPARARRWWLLIASWAFYASWHWPFLALLVGSGTLNHFGAIWVTRAADRRRRGALVIAANLVVLALFKYLDFMADNANGLLALLGIDARVPLPGWVLPLGLSFYLFEGISFIVDVVRKREQVRSFWDFQLYVAYFPHLVAGPIMRVKELIPQLDRRWTLTSRHVRDGVWLLVSGLFLKIVISDGLAADVDGAFARAPGALGGLDVWLMGAAFGLQIYFDFASYSRIAYGASLLCGLELVENFDFPYSARSPVEFWARWHMSLSRWIRDYLFYPLVGKKATLLALCRAAMVSMTLCGIWHGAGWTFVLWGVYHGLLIAAYHVVHSRPRAAGAAPASRPAERPAWFVAAGVVSTFALVSLGWILFRARSLEHAGGLLARALVPWTHRMRALSGTFYLHVALLLAIVWTAPHVRRAFLASWKRSETRPAMALAFHVGLGLMIGAAVIGCLIYLRGQTAFIYFQF
jgi:alginate O-acetyltransferase complex protein AlgI